MGESFLINNSGLIEVILILSPILFTVISLILLLPAVSRTKYGILDKKPVIFTATLTISIWCLQFVSDCINTECTAENLPELLAFSFFHTIKTFGGDDDFLRGIPSLIQAMDMIHFRSIIDYRFIVVAFGFCAPITGAALFLEIIAKIFPKVKHFFVRFQVFKKKYYFSELNERSLALAKSILETEKRAPVIIFTDVYVNKAQEQSSELLAEAKKIGSICLSDDITHLHKRGFGKRKFFLIDNNEIENLQALTNLSNKSNYKSLKKAEVFLFCQDPIYTDVERQVRETLDKKYKCRKWIAKKYYTLLEKIIKKYYKIDDEDETENKKYEILKKHLDNFYQNIVFRNRATTIIPIRCYRNLITNMLEETPLYEAIIKEKEKQEGEEQEEKKQEDCNLNVTILGVGDIGTEMFLTTYWMGQMLGCKLNISIISKEPEDEFWGRIDYLNPEIRRTMKAKDGLLRVYSDKKKKGDEYISEEERYNAPYANVKYISRNVQSEEFENLLDGNERIDIGEIKINPILDSHYILVSLGSDHMNLSVANTLKRRIGEYHIKVNQKESKTRLRTIINYVVYNADLSKTLNQEKFVCSYEEKPDIFIQAVGGVENVYCAENIFMTKYRAASEAAARSYDKKKDKMVRERNCKKRLNDEYEYWANFALRLHFKYKVFSCKYFDKSLFDAYKIENVEGKNIVSFSQEDYDKYVEDACKKYKNEYRKRNEQKPTLYDKIVDILEKCRVKIHLFKRTFRPFDGAVVKCQRFTRRVESFVRTTKSFLKFVFVKESEDDKEKIARDPKPQENELQWLEHRRWCAFLRTMGFRHTDDYEKYLQLTQSHKQMDIKLHPCLVECDKKGVKGKVDEFGVVCSSLVKEKKKKVTVNWNDDQFHELDMLDQLTYKLATLKKDNGEKYNKLSVYDFKQYDYPNNEYIDEIYF